MWIWRGPKSSNGWLWAGEMSVCRIDYLLLILFTKSPFYINKLNDKQTHSLSKVNKGWLSIPIINQLITSPLCFIYLSSQSIVMPKFVCLLKIYKRGQRHNIYVLAAGWNTALFQNLMYFQESPSELLASVRCQAGTRRVWVKMRYVTDSSVESRMAGRRVLIYVLPAGAPRVARLITLKLPALPYYSKHEEIETYNDRHERYFKHSQKIYLGKWR